MGKEYFVTQSSIECVKIESDDGKIHFIPKDLSNEWLRIFGLKDLNDDFIPNFEPAIKEVLNQYGVNEVHLKLGSLIKVHSYHREKYVSRIKSTLESPNALMEHQKSLIFIKDFGDEKFFTSVAKDENGEWIVKSNAPKSLNNLTGKIEKDNGRFIYGSLKELESIKTHPNAFTPLVDFQKQQAQRKIIQQTKPKNQQKSKPTNYERNI